MSDLQLTARCEGRNERHARISVWQNGAKAGVLTVEAEHEAAVIQAVNCHDALVAALRDIVAAYDEQLDIPWSTIRVALALAEDPTHSEGVQA